MKGTGIDLTRRPGCLFYGYQLGMSRREILTTRYGEFLDILSCQAVANGAARIKHHIRDYWDAIRVR